MRDSARIDEFCSRFAWLWKTYFPDWRFGQLVSNLQTMMRCDLFYLEEDEVLKKMEEFVSLYGESQE